MMVRSVRSWGAWVLLVGTLLLGPAQAGEEGADPSHARPVLVTQLGHAQGGVCAVNFSPDGTKILTAGGQTALLWEAATGKELRRFVSPMGFWRAAFTSDGTLMLSIKGGSVSLTETESGKFVRRFAGRGMMAAESATLSPDGTQLLAGGWANTAHLFDTATGKELRHYEGHTGCVRSVRFSPDGVYVLTASDDKSARLFETATAKEVRRFEGHVGDVLIATFSPDGAHVLTVGRGELAARLFDTATGKEVRRFEGHSAPVGFAIFSPDGTHVLTASADKTARLWKTETAEEVRRFDGHAGAVLSVAFSRDGSQLLTGSADMATRLFDTATGEEVRRFEGNVRPVRSAALSADARYVLVAHDDRSARLWDTGSGKEVRRFTGHSASLTSATFSPNVQYVLTTSVDRTARLFETASGKEVRRLEGHTGPVWSAAFSPDGAYVLTASADKTARLWDTESGQEVRRFEGHKKGVNSATFSRDGTFVLTGSSDRTARVWETGTAKEVRSFTGPLQLWKEGGNNTYSPANIFVVAAAAFSPDARHIVMVGDTAPHVWDVESGKALRHFRGHSAQTRTVTFSPDGVHVLTAGQDSTAHIWDPETCRRVRLFKGHSADLTSARYSPDGRHVLTASLDGTTRFWEASTGKQLCSLVSSASGNWVVVTPDGRFDTGDLDAIEGLHWLMPDDPMRAYPLEMFMRDYFEPKLMARVLAGEVLPKVPRLDKLNRALPVVRVSRVTLDPKVPGQARVTVEVEGTERSFLRGGKPRTERSGASDLRLFRDGRLVRWVDGVLALKNGRASYVFERVPLDASKGVAANEFSVYAFNADRVKSLTHRLVDALPAKRETRSGTVFVIGFGVDAFDESRWDLAFASADARALVEKLSAVLEGGDYGHVVPLLLTSQAEEKDGKRARTNHARKDDLRVVLDVLAGESVDKTKLARIPQADKLRAARPEDVVILSVSTHGVTGKDGGFYLLPSDAKPMDEHDKWLASCISAEELSEWLRGVDAGEMAMIVDACQSAASIEQTGFKPGPMGSRGLGQLAYSKRMRILAASQAAEVALESRLVKHGLLTYSLLVDGLEKGRADFDPKDGRTTLDEGLRYGLGRVPTLAQEVAEGRVRSVNGRGFRPAPESVRKVPVTQQPSLFDFSKGKPSAVTLSR